MTRVTMIFVTLPLLLATACSSAVVEAQEEVFLLEVAPHTVPCTGEMSGTCLQVKEPDEDTWRTFYDDIEGFDHEAGVRYTLEVARTEVPDPPADGSAYTYRLIRIVEQERVDG